MLPWATTRDRPYASSIFIQIAVEMARPPEITRRGDPLWSPFDDRRPQIKIFYPVNKEGQKQKKVKYDSPG